MKILVTGGAGFIGSHLVARLVNDGYKVRIIDNLTTGNIENLLEYLDKTDAIEFVKGDIRSPSLVEDSLNGIDAVVHLAAIVSVPFSVENPEMTFDVNVGGTINLLRSCAEKNVEKFVFISSCAVYGDAKVKPISEAAETNPISPYAESKLLGERYCLGFCQRQLLKSSVLRFFNVYGLRQGTNEYSGVITRFINKVTEKQSLVIYGDGSQTRDFVNVTDIVDAILASIKQNKAVGEVVNVGSGKPTSINALAKTIVTLSGIDLPIRYEDSRVGDIKESYAEISKAKKFLGYEPKVSLSAGLQTLLNA